MWWLGCGVLVGSVVIGGSLLSGCRRRHEETQPPPELPSSPPSIPTPAGTYTPPRPRIGPPSETASTPVSAPIPPVVAPLAPDCSFFARPALELNIERPRTELETLQNRVIPRMNIHAAESRQGNFSGILADTDLSSALASLQGVRIYFKEGGELALDTESDLMNLNTAFAHLQMLSNVQSDPSDPYTVDLRDAWDANRVTVILRGYNFQDSRVPHHYSSSSDLGGAFNRFRILSHQNYRDFPDMVRCVPDTTENSTNYYRALSSYTIRAAATRPPR